MTKTIPCPDCGRSLRFSTAAPGGPVCWTCLGLSDEERARDRGCEVKYRNDILKLEEEER